MSRSEVDPRLHIKQNMAGNNTNWPDQVVSLLLDTVREREKIWNTKSERYKNRNMKNAHYQEILQAIKVELPNVDLPSIKGE